MGLFDMLTGGSNRNNTYQSYGGSNYSSNNTARMIYQCSYCGRRENVRSAENLSRGACHSRGKDARGVFLPHDWRRL